jgi:hypothetical protein
MASARAAHVLWSKHLPIALAFLFVSPMDHQVAVKDNGLVRVLHRKTFSWK